MSGKQKKKRGAPKHFTREYRQHDRSRVSSESCSRNGAKEAKVTIERYGVDQLFKRWQVWRLANPSRPKRLMIELLTRLEIEFEREKLSRVQPKAHTPSSFWDSRRDLLYRVFGKKAQPDSVILSNEMNYDLCEYNDRHFGMLSSPELCGRRLISTMERIRQCRRQINRIRSLSRNTLPEQSGLTQKRVSS